MKRILFIISILISVTAYNQTTGFFRYDSVRFEKVGANSEFILLNGTRAVTGGVLTNLGNGRTRFVLPSGGFNTSLGSGYKIAVDGTNNVKSILPYNGLTGDSATSGQVGVRWGGTLTQNTTIDSGGFFTNFNLSRIGITNSAPNAKIDLVTNAIGITQADNSGILLNNTTPATVILNQNSPSLVFSGRGWKTGGPGSYMARMAIDVRGILGGNSGEVLMQFKPSVNGSSSVVSATIEAVDGVALSASGSKAGNNAGALISAGKFNNAAVWLSTSGNNLAFGNANNLATGVGFTGTDNIAIGSSVMYNMTSGFNNIGIGSDVMGVNSTGNINTAVGFNSMISNTTGFQNAAFGATSLRANTTGDKITAIGAGALEENTTGDFNTGVGMDALLHNSTGSNNTALGWLAYGNNLTGDHNSVFGYNSFNGVVNGTNNAIFGATATALNDTIDNAVGIGSGVIVPSSNSITIGNSSHTTNYQFGIAAGAGTKALRYDPTTRQLFYADTSAGGGGGGSGTVTSVDPGYGLIGTPDPITTTGTVIADTTILMNKAGAQVISGIKNFTSMPTFSTLTSGRVVTVGTSGALTDDDGFKFDPTANTVTITGTQSSVTDGPKIEFKYTSDANAAMSYFIYAHNNIAGPAYDAWWNGTAWVSSHAGSNFALYKSNDELAIGYNAGTAAGSSFGGGFNTTNGVRFSATGRLGIGVAPTEKLDVVGNAKIVNNSQTTGSTLAVSSSSTTSGAGASITLTGTAAAGDGSFAGTQAGLKISLSGTNATSTVPTFGINIDNAHAGTAALNYGAYVTTSNGGEGNAGYFQSSGTNAANTALNGTATGSGTSVNVAGKFNASGGNTNYAILTTGANSGFLVAAPTSALHTTSFATATRSISALRTLDATDKVIECTANTFTVTLPLSTGCIGREYVITNTGAGVITVATTSSEQFKNVTSTPITLTVNQFSTVTVVAFNGYWLRTSSL